MSIFLRKCCNAGNIKTQSGLIAIFYFYRVNKILILCTRRDSAMTVLALARQMSNVPQAAAQVPKAGPRTAGPLRGSLIKRFAKAATRIVVTALAAAALVYGGYLATHYAGKGAPLTAGEAAMVESVFGDEIDASKMRKHFRETSFAYRLAPKTVTGMVLPPLSHIDFYGDAGRSDDFSKDNPRMASLFMHEATHVWQNQNWRWSLHHLDKVRLYDYTLVEGARFDSFALEQKAEMVGDYMRIWLHPKGKIQSGHTASAEDILLRDVIEARFPRAKESRLALPPPAKPAPAKPKMPNS